MTQVCVSLMVEHSDRVLEAMIKARDLGADLLEWRLDVTRNADVETILRQAPLPIISTVRSNEQGGRFRGGRAEQLRFLLQAAECGSSYVDWEFRSGEPLPAELSRIRDRVIVSYHNFGETPADRELESLFEEMAATEAGVVKVVARAQRMEDNLSMLALIRQGQRRGVKVVAFCLGALGRISRVACPLVGGAFTYAALEVGEEAAPGQLAVTEMRQILELLR